MPAINEVFSYVLCLGFVVFINYLSALNNGVGFFLMNVACNKIIWVALNLFYMAYYSFDDMGPPMENQLQSM